MQNHKESRECEGQSKPGSRFLDQPEGVVFTHDRSINELCTQCNNELCTMRQRNGDGGINAVVRELLNAGFLASADFWAQALIWDRLSIG